MKFLFERAVVQGEGTFVGMPVDIFRVVGCSVGCAFCDEPARADVPDAMEYSAELLAELRGGSVLPLMVTGGEPLQQLTTDTAIEIGQCVARGMEAAGVPPAVLIETSGVGDVELVSCMFAQLPRNSLRALTVSPKRPTSLAAWSYSRGMRGHAEWFRAMVFSADCVTIKYLFAAGNLVATLSPAALDYAGPSLGHARVEVVVQPLWQEIADFGFSAWLRENYNNIMLALSVDPFYTTLRERYSGVVMRILPQVHKL